MFENQQVPNNQIRKEKYCVRKMDFKACNFGFAV